MNGVVSIVPIFSVIFIGWLATRIRFVSPAVEKGLTEFVFSIAVPALIFSAFTRPNQHEGLVYGFWVAYFGGAAAVWLLCATIARYGLKQDSRPSIMLGFSTSQSNTVFVGVPLILHTYGEAGATPLFMLLAVHMPIMMGAATLIFEFEKGQSPLTSLRRLGATLCRNPIFISLMAGSLCRGLAVEIPAVPRDIIESVGKVASVCALFALGASIERLGIGRRWHSIGLITLGKLVLHPLAVWLLATRVFLMPPVFVGVATLFAAMPVGINSYLLATRYKASEAEIAAGIAFTTLFSMLTTTCWLLILNKQV